MVIVYAKPLIGDFFYVTNGRFASIVLRTFLECGHKECMDLAFVSSEN